MGFVTDCNGLAKPLDFWPKTVYSTYMKNETAYQRNALDISYNGWENYETWNVALWLQNDEGLYNLAMECGNYEDFVNEVGVDNATPDGVKFAGPKVNVIQLNSDIFDL